MALHLQSTTKVRDIHNSAHHKRYRRARHAIAGVLGAAALFMSTGASAGPEIIVTDAWVRATVPAQKSTAGFMDIVATSDAKLIAVSSPAAKLTELHTMRIDGGIMRMRPLPAGIELPANRTISLEPGGSHLMLMQLSAPVIDGQFVPMVLTIEDAAGNRSTVNIEVPVRPITTK